MDDLKFSAISVTNKSPSGPVVMVANGVSFVVRMVDLRIYNQGRLTDFLVESYQQAKQHQTPSDQRVNLFAPAEQPIAQAAPLVTRRIQPDDMVQLEKIFQWVTQAAVAYYDATYTDK